MSEKTGVLTGFKEFLMRGNVIELAVAVVVGAAFTNIVNAVVKGVINPIVGALGSQNLDHYKTCLTTCHTDAKSGDFTDGIYILWGSVLSAVLTFVITAAVVYFLMILPMNKWKARQDAKKPVDDSPLAPTEVELLTEIRDALVAQRNGSVSRAGAGSAVGGGAGSVVTQKTQQ
ncbi:large conductance mechanosensitive channel protein MscL [Streptomyces sp. NPDC017529]|uniref:large conductance mechanosensitive channel protein MscL n=1 Tax=Streptomyces sp. NPDC017529 TaxID=3365000 RepID=UPI0037976E4F